MKTIKIGFITPDETDPLAFYRGTGPLTRLRKKAINFDYEHIPNNISWASIRKYDVIFMQRPWLPEHLQIAELCDKWNVPLIIDFDDWLFDLPISNPSYEPFHKNKKNIVQIANAATAITVATKKLGELFKSLLIDQNKTIEVIPNAYDVELFSKYRNDNNVKDRRKIFAWRGGNSHMKDLLSVKQDYLNLFDSYPDWEFVFIAQNPWFLDTNAPNVKTADALKIIEYFRALHDTAPAILAHPLYDCDFNRAKSMCSWLEATHARAAFIGPDFEEFNRDGIINYKDNFFEVASDLLNNPEKILINYEKSEKYIKENLTLDIVNAKRYYLFASLT